MLIPVSVVLFCVPGLETEGQRVWECWGRRLFCKVASEKHVCRLSYPLWLCRTFNTFLVSCGVGASDCGFNLHCPDYLRYGALFHMLLWLFTFAKCLNTFFWPFFFSSTHFSLIYKNPLYLGVSLLSDAHIHTLTFLFYIACFFIFLIIIIIIICSFMLFFKLYFSWMGVLILTKSRLSPSLCSVLFYAFLKRNLWLPQGCEAILLLSSRSFKVFSLLGSMIHLDCFCTVWGRGQVCPLPLIFLSNWPSTLPCIFVVPFVVNQDRALCMCGSVPYPCFSPTWLSGN